MAVAEILDALQPSRLAANVGSRPEPTRAEALLDWLESALLARGKEALADLRANPSAPDNAADLRKQLVKYLMDAPEALATLEAMLAKLPGKAALSSLLDSVGAALSYANTVTKAFTKT